MKTIFGNRVVSYGKAGAKKKRGEIEIEGKPTQQD